MSGFDFNNTKEQTTERRYGPVPDGSKVLIELRIGTPYKQASASNPIIGITNTGLYQINVSYHVAAGTYEGVWWFDSILLPAEQQKAALSDQQRKACEISAQRVRGIIEAHRNVNPKDTSPQAKSKRSISSWADIDNMTFPARLTIKSKGREYNGNTYYDNRISYVITPDNREYNQIMGGGEIINEGGALVPIQTNKPARQTFSEPEFPAFDADQVGSSSMDDVPF